MGRVYRKHSIYFKSHYCYINFGVPQSLVLKFPLLCTHTHTHIHIALSHLVFGFKHHLNAEASQMCMLARNSLLLYPTASLML